MPTESHAGAPIEADEAPAAPPLAIVHLTADPLGPRVVSCSATPLLVGVAPVQQAGLLLASPAMQRIGYVLCGATPDGHAAVRIGESLNAPSRLGEHFRDPPLAIETVILVGAACKIGRAETIMLEQLLFDAAAASGRVRIVGRRPAASAPCGSQAGLRVRWRGDLVPLLAAATGFLLLPPGPALAADPRPAPRLSAAIESASRSAAPARIDGPEERIYMLTYRGAIAQALVSEEGRVDLLAGSTLVATPQRDCKRYVLNRRAELNRERAVSPAGAGLLELRRDVEVRSLDYAARLVAGKRNPPGWRVVPPLAPGRGVRA